MPEHPTLFYFKPFLSTLAWKIVTKALAGLFSLLIVLTCSLVDYNCWFLQCLVRDVRLRRELEVGIQSCVHFQGLCPTLWVTFGDSFQVKMSKLICFAADKASWPCTLATLGSFLGFLITISLGNLCVFSRVSSCEDEPLLSLLSLWMRARSPVSCPRNDTATAGTSFAVPAGRGPELLAF